MYSFYCNFFIHQEEFELYKLLNQWYKLSLVKRIIAGLIIGIILGVTIPDVAQPITIFGALFVGALKAIAPMLGLFLGCIRDFAAQKRPTDEHEICHRALPFRNLLGGTRSSGRELHLPGYFDLGCWCRGYRCSWGRGGSPEGVALERRGQSSQGALQCQLYRHLVMGSYARFYSEECRSFNQADAVQCF